MWRLQLIERSYAVPALSKRLTDEHFHLSPFQMERVWAALESVASESVALMFAGLNWSFARAQQEPARRGGAAPSEQISCPIYL